MKHNFRTPHLLLALALAVGIISLSPASGGDFSKASLTKGLLVEETTSSGTSNATVQPNVPCDSTTGANCGPATTDNYNQQPVETYEYKDDGNYNPQPTEQPQWDGTSTSGGGQGGCAPGTICDYKGGESGGGEGGGMNMGANPSDKDCQFDKRDARRMYNEINQLIKRKTKAKVDTADLNLILTIVSEAKTKLESCSTMTWDELQAVRQTLMGDMGSGGVNATLSIYRCWDDYARQTKDYERMKIDFDRTKKDLESMPAGDMSDDVDAQIERIDKMPELTLKMLSLMKDNNCNIYNGYSDAQTEMEDLRWEMDDLRIEMDEFWPKFEQIRNTAWAGQMFDQVEKDIANAKETEYAQMPPVMQEKFDVLSKVGLDLVAKGRACLASGNVQCLKETQMRLEELGRKANQIFGGPEVDFEKIGLGKDMGGKFQEITKNDNFGEASEMLQYILSIDPTILDKITERDPAIANKMLKIMSRMPEEKKRVEYASQQNELAETLYEAITTAPQLEIYKEEILNSNLVGDVLTEAITTLEDVRDGAVQATEFIENIPQLIVENKTEAYNEGISNFKDVSLGDWYDETAHYKALNITGKTINGEQMFDPSGQTTFAEMLKVINEATGIGKGNGTTSYGPAQNDWSAGYFGAVEGKDVTFMNPDEKITRGQMARMIAEITDLPMRDVQTPFVDLAGNKYESYIKTLYANGVMNGNPDGTVKPNDSINRAEAFTLVKNMIDNLGLMAVDVKAIQEIETMKIDVDMDVKMDMDNGNYIKEDQGGGGSYNDNGNHDNGVKDTSDEMYDMMDWE